MNFESHRPRWFVYAGAPTTTCKIIPGCPPCQAAPHDWTGHWHWDTNFLFCTCSSRLKLTPIRIWHADKEIKCLQASNSDSSADWSLINQQRILFWKKKTIDLIITVLPTCLSSSFFTCQNYLLQEIPCKLWNKLHVIFAIKKEYIILDYY
jgi:hypothetical protein